MSGWACVCVRLGFAVVAVSMYLYKCRGICALMVGVLGGGRELASVYV